MTTEIKTSTYRLFKRQKDGSLKFIREVAYNYRAEVAPKNRTRVRAMTEAMLEAANARRLAEEEAFEALVDAACENA